MAKRKKKIVVKAVSKRRPAKRVAKKVVKKAAPARKMAKKTASVKKVSGRKR